MVYSYEESLKLFSNVVEWHFVKPGQLPTGFGGHNCNDCANAVKIGEKCKMYKPRTDFSRTDCYTLPCCVGWNIIFYRNNYG